MAQVNLNAIMVKVAREPKVRKIALNLAEELVDEQKEQLLERFDEHVVTQELEEGAEASNISGTLSGLSSHGGNLFSFIGFHEGDNPTSFIRNALIKLVGIKNKNELFNRFAKGGTVEIGFRVNIPSLREISESGGKDAEFPDGYSSGFWLEALEKGKLKGLSHYIYDEEFGNYGSRSGTGLQAKTKGKGKLIIIRSGDMSTAVPYVGDLLQNFAKNLRNSI